MLRSLVCWSLSVGLAAPASALAGKVPATVNIGIGPTVGTVVMPSLGGPTPISVGLALRAEGWVSKKTLRSKKVMRRVPRKYKGMVRSMDDLHVVPLPVSLLPDQSLIVPVNRDSAGTTVQGTSWTPVSVYLHHKVRPAHTVVAAAPRLGWVRFAPTTATGASDTGLQGAATATDPVDPSNHFFLGVDLSPELESSMTQNVGFAVGANVAPGLVLPHPSPGDAGSSAAFGVWVDGFVRVHIRKPIKVKI